MALVDYSGSESESEPESDSINKGKAPTPESARPIPTSNKPTFQKVVDRSNPHKIKVTLPEPAKIIAEDGNLESGPPAKRAKTGSGGMGGFNSFLPAPKRTAATSGGSRDGSIRKGGLAGGVNLKTGAAPGFSRDPAPSVVESSDWNGGAGGPLVEETKGHSRHLDTTEPTATAVPDAPVPEVAIESKKKSTMFRPLSVANKKPKKKKDTPISSLGAASSSDAGTNPQEKSKPKPSLFTAGEETQESSGTGSVTKGTYQPIVYHPDEPTVTSTQNLSSEDPSFPQGHTHTHSTDQTPQDLQPQSLSAIATDLNLSASAKRQLLGRHHKPNHQAHPSQAPTNLPKIVNFNTDEEYAANELLRQAGEAVQHNPVRGIAPGKHSLKQLVNAASNQKDALEEHFASGRRNKKEAGSKYGW